MEKDIRKAWLPGYQGDEIAVGLALAIALHALPISAALYKAAHPSPPEIETEVAKPVIAAALLKLGKPVDPKKLPDVVASGEDTKKGPPPDAGAPPPKAQESDLTNLIAKSDPFAEDAGKVRPEEGHALGVKEGTETDPAKVREGDAYAAQLGSFFSERTQYPTVISQGEINNLCVTYKVSVSPRMVIWHVQQTPARSSGNELFDDSARSMLQKLMDDHTPLPEPPDAVAELYRGRTLQLVLQGNPHGDGSRCK